MWEGIRNVINNPLITVLFALIMLDILVGITCAITQKSINSHVGITGLLKHSIVMALLVGLGTFAPTFNLEIVFNGLLVFYIVQYLVSLVENFIVLGIPLPKKLCDIISQLESDNKGVEENDD